MGRSILCLKLLILIALELTTLLGAERNSIGPINKSINENKRQKKQNSLDSATYEEFVDKINIFNKRMILPRVSSIVNLEFFKFVKLNLNRQCRLWPDASKCNQKDCQVNIFNDCSFDELSFVNTSLNINERSYNDELIKHFECDYDDDSESQYIDLTINPERYTGYSGESAHRIWRAIYDENCFANQQLTRRDMCFEKKLFYEAISGLHTSINIHVCATYPSISMLGTFEPNLNEFERRFANKRQYLKNLYSLYLLELKSLLKAKEFLLSKVSFPNEATKAALKNFLESASKLDILDYCHELSLQPNEHSNEIALHFRNITTTILDCAACDKCKLWGKVQLRGLGAAFKISSMHADNLHLNHQEIVSLVNGFARLSFSIKWLETFKHLASESATSSKCTDVGNSKQQNSVNDVIYINTESSFRNEL